MGAFPLDHPFSVFNDYYYMESGTPMIPIYILKKGNRGILIELYLNDHENGPRGRLFAMDFEDEYNFTLRKTIGRDISRPTIGELYAVLIETLKKELAKL